MAVRKRPTGTRQPRREMKFWMEFPPPNARRQQIARFFRQVEKMDRLAQDLLPSLKEPVIAETLQQVFRESRNLSSLLQTHLNDMSHLEYAIRLHSAIHGALQRPAYIRMPDRRGMTRDYRTRILRMLLKTTGVIEGSSSVMEAAREEGILPNQIARAENFARLLIFDKLISQIRLYEQPGFRMLKEQLKDDLSFHEGKWHPVKGPGRGLTQHQAETLLEILHGPFANRMMVEAMNPKHLSRRPKAEQRAYELLFHRYGGLFNSPFVRNRQELANKFRIAPKTVTDTLTAARSNLLRTMLELHGRRATLYTHTRT